MRNDGKSCQIHSGITAMDGTKIAELVGRYPTLGTDKFVFERDYDSLAAECERLRELVQAHEEVHADKRRLVREIDVIINGGSAAKQASLCDLVGDITALRESAKLAEKDAERYRWLRDNFSATTPTVSVQWNLRLLKDSLKTLEEDVDAAIDAHRAKSLEGGEVTPGHPPADHEGIPSHGLEP